MDWRQELDKRLKEGKYTRGEVQQVRRIRSEQNEGVHRTQEDHNKEKMFQFTHIVKDPLYNCAETVLWHASASMANSPKGKRTKRQLGRFKRPFIHGGKGELPSQSRILTAS